MRDRAVRFASFDRIRAGLVVSALRSAFNHDRCASVRRLAVAAATVVLAVGCGRSKLDSRVDEIAPGLFTRPLLESATESNRTRFTRLMPDQTGIDFVDVLEPQNNFSYVNIGAGVATGDYDGDGRIDVYLASIDSGNRLYRQIAPFQFADVTDAAGVDGGEAWSRGTTFVDIDGDDDLDLYVCNTEAANRLYLNQGDGSFQDAAAAFGLDHVGASVMASFVDYDRDGDLDCYLVTHRALHFMIPESLVAAMDAPAGTRRAPLEMRPPLPERDADGRIQSADPQHWFQAGPRYEIAGEPDVLFRNNGDGTFDDVTKDAGLLDYGLGLSATWLDVDEDGWLDLHVANDLLTPDRVYRNNGDGTFTEITEDALPHTPWFSMGADCADINNDGRTDFLVADMSATTHYRSKILMGDMSAYQWFMTHAWPRQLMRNALYLNSGTGRFLEIAHLAGLASSDWTWAVQLADLDNDGWVDAFFTNGAPRDDMNPDYMQRAREEGSRSGPAAFGEVLKSIPSAADANLAFRNDGDLHFEDVSVSWGVDHTGVSFGACVSDLDGDGDLDLVVNNMNEPASIYRNDGDPKHRVVIRLRGAGANTHGVGALVHVQTASTKQQRRLLPARGYMSSNVPVVHFGLGADDVIETLRVEWPGGRVQSFENLAADAFYEVHEPGVHEPGGESSFSKPVRPSRAPRQFVEVSGDVGLAFRHRERAHDDFATQALLPSKQSQLGPGVAAGDMDADGDVDFYIAGAAGQAGAMYVADGVLGFTRVPGAWMQDLRNEDMAPLFFDADGDDDLDLFVTSGSVEHGVATLLRDRLYLNDGTGTFVPGVDRLPELDESSTGAVAAADFDRDGDLDLFVGGRVVPGRYPLAPRSFLLRNDSGRFTDVTDAWAAGLRRVGMVTSALWTDADADGHVDLLLTLEWGAVRLYRNDGARLVDYTQHAGLSHLHGWWNSVTGGDFDHDGDIDYVVMNSGLNTKYGSPTEEHPTLLFYGDMEGDGSTHLIEAHWGPEGLLPFRGRSCSSGAMPFIAEKFPTYHSFASAVLEEIYDPDKLQGALTLRATTLASGVLMNDGSARFSWNPLPRLAQTSPGYGVVTADFDADGHLDVYAVQNSFTREPETGVWAGGLSTLLRGHGDGSFSVVGARESGLIVAGDAKGLVLADFDRDAWPDVLITQNDDRVLAFRNQGVSGRTSFSVSLSGPQGNPTAVGARVALEPGSPHSRTAELYAGSGYLSQSTAELFFAITTDPTAQKLSVVWPDGYESTHIVNVQQTKHVRLSHPDTNLRHSKR